MNNSTGVTLQTTIQASEDVVVSQLDDELVMMSVDQGQYYSLDDIGRRVWELIGEPRTITAVCDIVVDEYDVTRAECEKDILAWLGELVDEKLVLIIDGQ